MPRNADEARERLRRAAIELFAENGFDQTTAAQIAARAGVTERTFFRHFPDKREVLFDGENILATALTEAIAEAPPDLSPVEMLRRALAAVTPMLEANRPFSEPRQRIIAATPSLQEREVAKHFSLARLVGEALRRRGVEPLRADLTARVALAALGHALATWFADPAMGLDAHIEHAFAELQQLSNAIAPASRSHQ